MNTVNGKGGIALRIRKKLKSRRGETLSEVLVAVMVGALAIALFTVMLSSAVRIIQKNRTALSDYYAGNNALIRQEAAAQYDVTAHPYTPTGSDRMTVTLEGVLGGANDVEVPADYYVHDYRGRTITVYYKKD